MSRMTENQEKFQEYLNNLLQKGWKPYGHEDVERIEVDCESYINFPYKNGDYLQISYMLKDEWYFTTSLSELLFDSGSWFINIFIYKISLDLLVYGDTDDERMEYIINNERLMEED